MKILQIAAVAFICVLFIAGCGTKRQYFDPSDTVGKARFDGSLSDSIVEVANEGATLANGRVITSSGVEQDIKLPKDKRFLGEFGGKFITTTNYGLIEVKDANQTLLYSRDLNTMIASAAAEGGTLAVITADNTQYIIDMNNDTVVFKRKFDTLSALDSRIASPYFLGGLVIFPTLDGKLAIVDRDTGALIRNVVVSAQSGFNNVIFLDVVDDRMFAATAHRIISISPTNINFIDADIKDAIVLKDRLFVFTKDGNVMLCDLDLKVKNSTKFPFALFAGAAVKGQKLYIVEKRGYMIVSDIDLKKSEIWDFPSKIDDFLFVGGGKIFYDDSYYTLE